MHRALLSYPSSTTPAHACSSGSGSGSDNKACGFQRGRFGFAQWCGGNLLKAARVAAFDPFNRELVAWRYDQMEALLCDVVGNREVCVCFSVCLCFVGFVCCVCGCGVCGQWGSCTDGRRVTCKS
jgi:hypothetical protein